MSLTKSQLWSLYHQTENNIVCTDAKRWADGQGGDLDWRDSSPAVFDPALVADLKRDIQTLNATLERLADAGWPVNTVAP